MSNLVVLAFDTETGAEQMRDDLMQMQKEHIIGLDDAAVAIKYKDGKTKIKQVQSLAGAGALGGAFWGFLIGLIFLVPVFGLVIGAATGALMGKYHDLGVDLIEATTKKLDESQARYPIEKLKGSIQEIYGTHIRSTHPPVAFRSENQTIL
ncbi:MAG: DUF1269 domain-containing protein [Methanotrichaceae archaeon]|nr:DUF1269 domain-containing protein [Methanotrichaceae archaeon]